MLYSAGSKLAPYAMNKSNSLYLGQQETIEEYTRRFIQYDYEGMRYVHAQQSLHPIRDTDVWPDLDAFLCRDDIKFTRERLGVLRRVYYNLSDDPAHPTGLILQYDEQTSEVTTDFVKASQSIAPHLAKAVELSRMFDPLKHRYNAVLSVLNKLQTPICITTGSGEVIVSNTSAEHLLAEFPSLRRDAKQRLTSTNPQIADQLASAISVCSEVAAGNCDETCKEIILHRDAIDPVLLLVSPLRDPAGEIELHYSGALVVMIDPLWQVNIPASLVRRAYGLTESEGDVATLLTQAYTIDEIAEIRSVSPATIRTQLKIIYQKIGVRSRAMFMLKMVKIVPPLIE